MARTSVILLLVLVSLVAYAQAEPPWLLVERAEQLVENREFGLAIQTLRTAQQLDPDRGETLFALGRVYKSVGDFTVAEDYFEQSLSAPLEASFTSTLVRYELADIYDARRDIGSLEDTLMDIVSADIPNEDQLLPLNPVATLKDQGLDRFLVLYRLTETAATEARSRLGRLLVGLGRYAAAGDVLSISVLQQLTTLVDHAIRSDPLYEFTRTTDLFARVADDAVVQTFLAESFLFEDIYYLAASYWGEGEEFALDLWDLLAQLDPGMWGQRALRQLREPRLEPLLVPTR